MNIFRVLFFLLAGAALLNITPAAAQEENKEENKPVTANAGVNMLLLPVFAAGPDGEPVYDLKKEDFQLFAGGAPMEIRRFFRYGSQHPETVKIQRPSRAMFIIIDAVFNSFHGYRRSKKIAAGIIRNSAPDDICIALESRANGSLHYVGGPETKKKTLISRIKKLRFPSRKWNRGLHNNYNWTHTADTDAYSAPQDRLHESLLKRIKTMEKMNYKNQTHYAGDLMDRFKFALKAVTRPKIVFLISKGVSKAAFREVQTTYGNCRQRSPYTSPLFTAPTDVDKAGASREKRMFDSLERMVRAVNEGGGVLFAVSPSKAEGKFGSSGEMSLRYLVSRSGGKYIAGSDTQRILKEIDQTTAAYYELEFLPTAAPGDRFDVLLKCKRDGVTVHTFKNTEANKSYGGMKPLEKKIFALNMAVGGSWSRMTGRAARVRYLRLGKGGEKNRDRIRVPLPPKMQNKELDIFSVRMDRKTRKVDIDMVTRKVGDTADLVLRAEKEKASFFVIIEPVFAYCIYNRV